MAGLRPRLVAARRRESGWRNRRMAVSDGRRAALVRKARWAGRTETSDAAQGFGGAGIFPGMSIDHLPLPAPERQFTPVPPAPVAGPARRPVPRPWSPTPVARAS